ncbi:hypothetical protein MKZ02_20170 [Pseudobacillus sp. FSL P4-0506]|uniref:hypothetical protein n=1 Tax=Pseudobacillus sp. FSL P4-0506 TaxID=2921576 RepID=UPI0030FB92E7
MSEDLQWRARIFADKALKAEVQKEITKLALVVLGNHKLKIEHNKEGFDSYVYCKHNTKQFCPVGSRTKHYRGRFRGYVVYGHTKMDVYLEVLKLLANDNSVYFPIVAPRTDDEWVEREEYDKLKEENQKYKKALEDLLNKK